MPRQPSTNTVRTIPSAPLCVFLLVLCVLAVGGSAAADGGSVAEDVTVYADDVEHGDQAQQLSLDVRGLDGDRLVLEIDVTAFETATGADTTELALDERRAEFHGASLDDATVETEADRTVLRLTLSEIDDRFRAQLLLTGLDTDDAEHVTELTHGIHLVDPDTGDEQVTESEPFDVYDPAQLDPTVQVNTGLIAIGEDDQRLTFRATDLPAGTDELHVCADVTTLADAGIGFDGAGVVVDEDAGDGWETVDATLDDGLLRLAVDVEDGTDAATVRVTLVGLETDGAAMTSDLVYPVGVAADDDPELDAESDPFRTVDPNEVETHTPATDDPANGSDEGDESGVHGDGGEPVIEEPSAVFGSVGIGVLVIVLAVVAATIVARRR